MARPPNACLVRFSMFIDPQAMGLEMGGEIDSHIELLNGAEADVEAARGQMASSSAAAKACPTRATFCTQLENTSQQS